MRMSHGAQDNEEGGRMKRIMATLAGMRKPQEFVVYPHKDGASTVTVQSDRAIGQFDPKTGVGVLNWRGSNSKYFPHLTQIFGAEPYRFPVEFVYQCCVEQPKSGDLIGSSSITGPVYVA